MLAFAIRVVFFAFFANAGFAGLMVRAIHVRRLVRAAASGKAKHGDKADGEKRFFHGSLPEIDEAAGRTPAAS
jgi:hypothetical protein